MGLNRERIIRGLACCKGSYDCFTCDIYKRGCAGFREGLAKDALSLINELTEGIKARDDTISRFIETMPLVKADTVKKMRELLTTFFDIDDMLKYNEVDADYINEQINRIAEEMIKGD